MHLKLGSVAGNLTTSIKAFCLVPGVPSPLDELRGNITEFTEFKDRFRNSHVVAMQSEVYPRRNAA